LLALFYAASPTFSIARTKRAIHSTNKLCGPRTNEISKVRYGADKNSKQPLNVPVPGTRHDPARLSQTLSRRSSEPFENERRTIRPLFCQQPEGDCCTAAARALWKFCPPSRSAKRKKKTVSESISMSLWRYLTQRRTLFRRMVVTNRSLCGGGSEKEPPVKPFRARSQMLWLVTRRRRLQMTVWPTNDPARVDEIKQHSAPKAMRQSKDRMAKSLCSRCFFGNCLLTQTAEFLKRSPERAGQTARVIDQLLKPERNRISTLIFGNVSRDFF